MPLGLEDGVDVGEMDVVAVRLGLLEGYARALPEPLWEAMRYVISHGMTNVYSRMQMF